ncbi:hypothetical protein ACLF3G_23465 [Falsiroseomonas sp. HC035]|uniref:Tc toxin subunit A-related protein n=1 Tax=Falsiroseomonas sp. HC035 TaxID=3390999 RepID=UPI003D32055E
MTNPLNATFHNGRDHIDWFVDGATGKLGKGHLSDINIPLPLTPGPTLTERRSLAYAFTAHQHPFVTALVERLAEGSVAGLQAANVEDAPGGAKLPDGSTRPLLHEEFFPAYAPTALVSAPHPVHRLEFGQGSAYGVYNDELFLHVHLAVAAHCTAEGRYELAQRWLHNIFDPTDRSDAPAPARFWKFRPFRTAKATSAERLMTNLATGADPALRDATVAAIEAWEREPFNPHLVARFRPDAYMVRTVTAYLDNLIAWGDLLFRQDTRESINEAMSHYVLASLILGRRPQRVPSRGQVAPQSYMQLRSSLDEFGNALRDIEADVVFNMTPAPAPGAAQGGRGTAAIESIGQSLYFCVPRDDRLLGYWDTVADRLFKIRNSLNLLGVFRQLPLFEPPIDPALLARAAASGLDVSAVLAGLNQPLPTQRFLPLVQRAAELCREVQSLGASLLSAMEKEDGEALQILRARHERSVLELAEQTRYAAVQEAAKSREAVERTLAAAAARWTHFNRLLGENPSAPPGLDPIDMDALAALRLRAAEPEMPGAEVEYDAAAGLTGDLQGRALNPQEKAEMDLLLTAQTLKDAAGTASLLAGPLGAIPDIGIWAAPLGAGGSVTIGGKQISAVAQFAAQALGNVADMVVYQAGRAAKIGGFVRREQEWTFQANQAALEINGILRQLRAAQIREAMAARELEVHRKQIENARAVEEFLADERKGKVTRKSLYAWMRKETRGLHSRAFQLALDVARKAERAFQHELGDRSARFIDGGYAAGREGLLAGERLLLDVRRMESGYHDANRRELEMVRHVSLRQLDPLALVALRTAGACTVRVPEEFFDLDAPGQYFRRIRSVAVTIPCVLGPYASVRCRLTLVRSSIRVSPNLLDGAYERDGEADRRFDDHMGSLETMVTSTAQNDPGVFEAGPRDERLMPFEGSGAVSEWRIELPKRFRAFDYATISDLILHMRITARQAGGLLQAKAEASIGDRLKDARMAGRVRLFSLRHDFPTEWARFKAAKPANPGEFVGMAVELTDGHYPFWTRGQLAEVVAAKLLVAPDAAVGAAFEVSGKAAAAAGERDTLGKDAETGLFTGDFAKGSPSAGGAGWTPAGAVPIFFESNAVLDAWLAIEWRSA